MFKIKVLNHDETVSLLGMDRVIEAVSDAYKMKAEANTEVFPLVFHEFQPGMADMDIKSGWLKSSEVFGLKLVSWFGENVKKNLPALIGTVMIFDANTGAPIGLMDGTHITGVRTGAAGAIGTKCLAREDSKSLLMVGAGHVATYQIAAMMVIFPNLKKVRIYDAINYSSAGKMADTIMEKLKKSFGIQVDRSIEFVATDDIERAVSDSDIIITATPSKQPIIKKEWVKSGTHFSCIGADMPGKQEIDSDIFRGARVFTDDIEQCINVGEIELPIKSGILKREDIAGEIGDILIGKTTGRQNDEQITIFDATGTALLDLITGKLALDEANKQKIGVSIDL